MSEPLVLGACKLCGCAAEFGEVTDMDHPDFGGHFIACTNAMCQCCVGLRYASGDDPKPLLAEQWNRRASDDSVRAELIEECAKIADAEGLSPNASASYCAAAFHIGMCIRALKSPPPGEK